MANMFGNPKLFADNRWFVCVCKYVISYLSRHIVVCLIDFRIANDYQAEARERSLALDYIQSECNENMERNNSQWKYFILLSHSVGLHPPFNFNRRNTSTMRTVLFTLTIIKKKAYLIDLGERESSERKRTYTQKILRFKPFSHTAVLFKLRWLAKDMLLLTIVIFCWCLSFYSPFVLLLHSAVVLLTVLTGVRDLFLNILFLCIWNSSRKNTIENDVVFVFLPIWL